MARGSSALIGAFKSELGTNELKGREAPGSRVWTLNPAGQVRHERAIALGSLVSLGKVFDIRCREGIGACGNITMQQLHAKPF
jgi:hypothetical protein